MRAFAPCWKVSLVVGGFICAGRCLAGNVAMPPDLGVAGFYEPMMLYPGDSGAPDRLASDLMTVLDTDDDGRDEILLGLSPGAAWRVIRWDAVTGNYDISRLVYLPMPGLGSLAAAPTIVSPLAAGGSPKALLNLGRLNAIYDARSGKLERLADSYYTDASLPLGVVDFDADGQNEIVLGGGPLLRVLNSTLTRELGTTRLDDAPARREYAVANFDADPAIEMVTSAGEVFEFEDYLLRRVGTLPTRVDGFAFIGTANLDADPQSELVGVYGDEIRVFDVDSNTVKWRATMPPTLAGLGAARLRDVSGDGVPDVIVAMNGHPGMPGTIAIYDGKDGHERLRFQHPDLYVFALNLGDFEGDGGLEMAVLTMRPFTGPNQLYIFDADDGTEKWRSGEELIPLTAAAQGNVDGDGSAEIVAAVRGLRGIGDIRLTAYDAAGYTRKWTTTHQILPMTGTGDIESLAIADVDGHGSREIAVGLQKDGVAQVVLVSGDTRQYLRAINLQPYDHVRALVAHDMDGDGIEELIAAASAPYGSPLGARAFILDGASGQVVASAGMDDWPYRYVHAMRLADVTGDGHADIVMAGQEGAIMVVDGVTRAVHGEVSATAHYGLALVDVEGDAAAEIVVGKEDGSVHVLRASDFTLIRSFKPCDSPVLALQAATLSGNQRGDVHYACGEGVGLWNLRAGGTGRGLTGVIGGQAGFGNLLWATGTGADPHITVSTISGLRFLARSAPVAPYVLPWRAAQPNYFISTWRGTVIDKVTLGAFTGRPATLELLEGPGTGTFQLGTGGPDRFTYSPSRPGLEHFTVRATDGLTSSVPVTLSLFATNSAPSAYAVTEFTVTRAVPFQGSLSGTDPDGDPLVYRLVDSPNKGTLTFSPSGQFTYVSAAGASGEDSFAYVVSDAFAQSAVVSVVLRIQDPAVTPPPPNAPPPASSGGGAGGGGGGGGLELVTLLALLGMLVRRRFAIGRVPRTLAFW